MGTNPNSPPLVGDETEAQERCGYCFTPFASKESGCSQCSVGGRYGYARGAWREAHREATRLRAKYDTAPNDSPYWVTRAARAEARVAGLEAALQTILKAPYGTFNNKADYAAFIRDIARNGLK